MYYNIARMKSFTAIISQSFPALGSTRIYQTIVSSGKSYALNFFLVIFFFALNPRRTILPNDIRFAETKPLNEGRTSFLFVTCCYAPAEGLAGFAGWNWLAVRITVYHYVVSFAVIRLPLRNLSYDTE